MAGGGESGPRHRSLDPAWVAFFFKQWGGRIPKTLRRELEGRSWDEMSAREAVISV
ncbi:hypothetical protein [Streptomyces sp. 3N207]|uniref:hypothetical protein n=1 Tax=Streptomyces sp. 3N207 TaxID=3457417 RepID=UPI003FD58228